MVGPRTKYPSAARLLVVLTIFSVAVSCRGTGQESRNPATYVQDVVLGRDPARQERAWDHWARNHLQSGDIVFMRGQALIMLGLVNFSRLSMHLTDSSYSHVGVVSIEDDRAFVYDIVDTGPRRTPFGKQMVDPRITAVAVKRLRPQCRGCIPAAIAYCQEAYQQHGQFDSQFALNNDRLYCTELVELAFRHGGQPISEPVRIDRLPRFAELSKTLRLLELLMPIELDQEVFVPGNEKIGIWACPALELILEVPDTSLLPPGSEVAARCRHSVGHGTTPLITA